MSTFPVLDKIARNVDYTDYITPSMIFCRYVFSNGHVIYTAVNNEGDMMQMSVSYLGQSYEYVQADRRRYDRFIESY